MFRGVYKSFGLILKNGLNVDSLYLMGINIIIHHYYFVYVFSMGDSYASRATGVRMKKV